MAMWKSGRSDSLPECPTRQVGSGQPKGARDREQRHDHAVRSGQDDRHPATDPDVSAVLHSQSPVNGHHPREGERSEDKLEEPRRGPGRQVNARGRQRHARPDRLEPREARAQQSAMTPRSKSATGV